MKKYKKKGNDNASPLMFFEIGAVKNFAKFARLSVGAFFLIKVQAWLKKRLPTLFSRDGSVADRRILTTWRYIF